MTQNEEKRAELMEHLAELRTRIFRILIYVAVGAGVAWFAYDQLLHVLVYPAQDVMAPRHMKFLLTNFTEPFMVRMQICMVAGLIFVSPLVIMEIWGFISPGLTKEEKRPLKWIAPLSVVLFLCGIALCYMIMPKAFEWFAAYIPKGTELKPSLQQTVLFIVKTLLAFGIVFELPVVLMLLAKVGIVNSKLLKTHWRTAMVVVAIVAAVATPSNDAFSMLMMAIPVSMLYFLSIGLVRMVEGKPRRL